MKEILLTYSVGSSDFSLNDWNSHGQETNTQTLDSSSSDEAGKVGSKSLKECHGEVDKTSNSDASFPSNNITKVTSEERSDCSRELEAGYCDTNERRVDVVG